jgi:hypothetical protein
MCWRVTPAADCRHSIKRVETVGRLCRAIYCNIVDEVGSGWRHRAYFENV